MAEQVRADASVVTARRAGNGGGPDDGDSYWFQDLGSAVFGRTVWELVLDVRPPAGEPYRVPVRTPQPNRLFGIRGFLSGDVGIAPGLVLPVLIDPARPDQVEVDWKAFEATPGASDQLRSASDAHGSTQAAAIASERLRRDPGRYEQNRAVVLDSAQALAEGVRSGTRAATDLEAILRTNVPLGLITQAEADAIWHSATEPGV